MSRFTILLICFLQFELTFNTHGQNASADSFRWSSVPSVTAAGGPFLTSLEALDADSSIASGYNGTAQVTALAAGVAPRLLISEVLARNTRAIEICNVSDAAVPIGGWRIAFYDATTWPAPRATFVVPAGTICASREVFQIWSGGNAPGLYPMFFLGTDLVWSSVQATSPIAVLLSDNAGNPADFFCACGGYPFRITSPVPIPENLWQGLPLPVNSGASRSYQRSGGFDHNSAVDWLVANSTLGGGNTGLRFPFSAPLRKINTAPNVVQLSQGLWQGLLTIDESANGVWLHADNGAGLVGDSSRLDIVPGPPLAMELPAGGSEATAGFLGTGRIFVSQALATNLTLTLSTDIADEIVLPPSVILPAGQTNVTFSVTNLDDDLLDGLRAVTVTASAPQFSTVRKVITNADDETVELTVTIPAAAREGDGFLVGAGRVIVNRPAGIDYPLALISSATNEVQVPPEILIPAGQTSAVFNFSIIDDANLDGNQTATVRANAFGGATATAEIVVADNENPMLRLFLTSPVEEGQGTLSNAVQVTLGGNSLSNVSVNLVSLSPGRLQVPSTVVVPAGKASILANLVVLDDILTNASEIVQVNATAAGFAPTSSVCGVRDNDLHHYSLANIPAGQISGQPIAVTAFAYTIDANIPSTYAGQAILRASGHAGPVPVSPSNITFTAGQWLGTIVVVGESRGTILTLDDGLGHIGISNPIDVSLMSTSGPPVSDLVYDASRGQLLAGVLASGGSSSNSIVGIDPASGGIAWSLPLGTEPGRLALSDDYSFLYVGGITTGGLTRVNLSTRTVALRFPLGYHGSFGPYFVEDMEVMPGNPRTVVVSRRVGFNNYNQGLAIYDDAIQRPLAVGPGSFAVGYRLGFYGSSNKLFGVWPDAMIFLSVVTNGLVAIDSRAGAPYVTDFEHADGLLYGRNGHVLWPSTLNVAGSFPTSGSVRPDASSGRIAFVSGNRLRVFDQYRYREVGTIDMTMRAADPAALVRCGAARLAFRAENNRLVILRTDLIQEPALADLNVTQTSSVTVPVVGSSFTYQITISNAGPASATNVVVVDQLPSDATFLSAVSSQGLCEHTNGVITCHVGTLPTGASMAVMIEAVAKVPGELVNNARAIGGALNLTNDFSSVTNIAIFGSILPAMTEIQLNANELAYDVASNRLWASVVKTASRQENGLWSIRMETGLSETPIRVGTEPTKMVISDDGKYLYVAVHPAQSTQTPTEVHRFSTQSRLRNLQFSAEAGDMAVVPGDNSTVAIARSASIRDLAIYREGVEIRRSAPEVNCHTVEFGGASNLIYAVNRDYGNTLFFRIDVTSTNLFLRDATPGLLVHTPDLRFAYSHLFASDGIVVDPVNLKRIANLPARGLMQADIGAEQFFYLGQNATTSEWMLTSIDPGSLRPNWTAPLPGVRGLARSLVSCGPGILAFNTTMGQLFILNTALLPHLTAADLQIWFQPPTSGGYTDSTFVFTGLIRNNGPAPAMNIVLTNTLSEGTVVRTLSASHGSCTNLAGVVVCQFDPLQAGDLASFTLTTMKTNAGTLLSSARVYADSFDPLTIDNKADFTALILPVVPPSVPDSADVSLTENVVPIAADQLLYTLVVSNAGPNTAAAVVLSDTYANRGMLISIVTTQGNVVTNIGSVSVNLGSMPPATAATVLLTIRPPLRADVANSAQVSSSTGDPVRENNFSASVVTPGGESVATAMNLAAADIAYAPSTRKLYATVPGYGGITNSVLRVDEPTGSWDGQVNIGEPPGMLAISEQDLYLYVARTTTGGVTRIHLPTAAVDLSFSLIEPDPPRYPAVGEMEVMPGQPDSLAVSLLRGQGNLGVYIYDHGVPRTNSGPASEYGGIHPIAFDGPNRIYQTRPFAFRRLSVGPSGVQFIDETTGLVPGYEVTFEIDSGWVYFNSGRVTDPVLKTNVGQFPAAGLVLPDMASGRVYFLVQPGNPFPSSPLTLRAFDATNRTELWSLAAPPNSGSAQKLIKLGTNGLACRTDANRVIFFRTPQLSTPSADVAIEQTLSPSRVTVNGTVTATLTVRNNGLWTTKNVRVLNPLPAGSEFMSGTVPGGSCVLSNDLIVCSLDPTLANGATATITLIFKVAAVGPFTNEATLLHDLPDLNPANDRAAGTITVESPPNLSISDATVLEGSDRRSVTFSLGLSSPSTLPASVHYRTADGTAVAGIDYDLVEGIATIPENTTAATITLSPGIYGNTRAGQNRFFVINLNNPTNASLVRSQGTAYIVEDDFNSVSVQSATVVEGQNGRTNIVFSFTLIPPGSNTVSVDYATSGGTATIGSDYQARAGYISFSPGSTNQLLRIPVLGDLCNEPDETFLLQLSSPLNSLLLTNEVTGRILNDDPVPLLRILSLAPDTDGWQIQFSSACGQNYRLMRSETLAPPSWWPVIEGIAGTGDTVTVRDTAAPDSQVFYRIERLP